MKYFGNLLLSHYYTDIDEFNIGFHIGIEIIFNYRFKRQLIERLCNGSKNREELEIKYFLNGQYL